MTSPALLGEYDCRSKNGTANVGEGRGREVWGGGGSDNSDRLQTGSEEKRICCFRPHRDPDPQILHYIAILLLATFGFVFKGRK